MESKVKKRLSNILSNDNKEKEKLQLIIKNVYQVRHKMIHKAKRINIDFKELSNIQMIMINLFLRLIQFNTEFEFKDKETLIDKLEEKNANA
jgi:RecB family endonuclease NucS